MCSLVQMLNVNYILTIKLDFFLQALSSICTINVPIFKVCFIISGVLNMATSAENPLRFSCHTLDKATKAKVNIFYKF